MLLEQVGMMGGRRDELIGARNKDRPLAHRGGQFDHERGPCVGLGVGVRTLQGFAVDGPEAGLLRIRIE